MTTTVRVITFPCSCATWVKVPANKPGAVITCKGCGLQYYVHATVLLRDGMFTPPRSLSYPPHDSDSYS